MNLINWQEQIEEPLTIQIKDTLTKEMRQLQVQSPMANLETLDHRSRCEQIKLKYFHDLMQKRSEYKSQRLEELRQQRKLGQEAEKTKKKKGKSTRTGEDLAKSKSTTHATLDTAKMRKSKTSLKAYESLTTVSKDDNRIVISMLQVVPSPKRGNAPVDGLV